MMTIGHAVGDAARLFLFPALMAVAVLAQLLAILPLARAARLMDR